MFYFTWCSQTKGSQLKISKNFCNQLFHTSKHFYLIDKSGTPKWVTNLHPDATNLKIILFFFYSNQVFMLLTFFYFIGKPTTKSRAHNKKN